MYHKLRELGQWVGIVAVAALTGLVLGHALDLVLAAVSFDYVFPYDHYRERGAQCGLLIGMVAGTTLHWLRQRCTLAGLVGCWTVAVLVVVAMTLVSGGVTAFAARIAPDQTVGKVITTPARHAFCQGLVWGAKWSVPLAVAAFLAAARPSNRRLDGRGRSAVRGPSDAL